LEDVADSQRQWRRRVRRRTGAGQSVCEAPQVQRCWHNGTSGPSLLLRPPRARLRRRRRRREAAPGVLRRVLRVGGARLSLPGGAAAGQRRGLPPAGVLLLLAASAIAAVLDVGTSAPVDSSFGSWRRATGAADAGQEQGRRQRGRGRGRGRGQWTVVESETENRALRPTRSCCGEPAWAS
jgi:hypothetical protein